MSDVIDDGNFLLYCAKHYDNPQCYDTEEFYDDLKRFKYLKRLFVKYQEYGELKERLILNHIIVLYNVFGVKATDLLVYRLKDHLPCLKPFLVMLGYMPDIISLGSKVYSSDIPMDGKIVEALRKL